MATLPYSKTQIRDLSAFTNIGDGTTSLNIATVINAKTGPLERVTLRSFDDLLTYFCSGTKITATDDVTIQTVGALLNTTPVDVIRVGTANIKIGRTDKGDIIYTDKDFNLIDLLTRVKFTDNSVRENSLAIFYDDVVYYVGDEPAITGATLTKVGDDVTIQALILGVIGHLNDSSDIVSYTDSTFISKDEDLNVVETQYTSVTRELIPATQLFKPVTSAPAISVGNQVLIGSNTYIFIGDGSSAPDTTAYDNPVEIGWISNTIPASLFIARLASKLDSSIVAASHVTYDFSNVTFYSENISKRIVNNTFTYNKSDSYDSFYCIVNNIAYLYNADESVLEGQTYQSVRSIQGSATDIIDIFTALEVDADTQIFVANDDNYLYFNDVTITTMSIEQFLEVVTAEDLYKYTLTAIEYLPEDYSVFIDGTVYYCGATEPSIYEELEVKDFYKLSEESLAFDVFVSKLFYQLESDRTIGRISTTSIYLTGESNIVGSDNLKITVSTLDQLNLVKDAKFAVVAKFPCSQKLFNFSFISNTDIENYKVINLTYTYNQITETVSMSFDSDAVDGYGKVLYYNNYNEGDYENLYVHFIELNQEVETPMPAEEVNVQPFGDELIMATPEATDYANAIKKYYDYEDKMYSFIWDAGYCSPILAKAMIALGQEINAQVVPSFPPNYKKVEDILGYHNAIGANSFQVVEVVPGHKSTYCGSFLTTVPGSLSYIVARVNSYNNVTSEFQPLFGATRGAVSAPNLTWRISKEDQQKLADANINSIVNTINGTYLNFNLTSQKASTYLSEEQNVYMSNTIAHVCQETNPKWIAEFNDKNLWEDVVNILTQKLTDRMISGKAPTLNALRVICNDKLNTQASIEARQLKYKVEVQYTPSVAYVLAYEDVVRLNSF